MLPYFCIQPLQPKPSTIEISYLERIIPCMRLLAIFFLLAISMDSSAQKKYPYFSLSINKVAFNAEKKSDTLNKNIAYTIVSKENGLLHDEIEFKNISSDTIEISNLVPYGTERDHVYITGLG